MSVARPVNQPTNPEEKNLRSAGRISRESNSWVAIEESKKVSNGYIHSCGTYLMGKTVYLTVRDGLFPFSGGGDVRTVTVPYCPNCEEEPKGDGYITPNNHMVIR